MVSSNYLISHDDSLFLSLHFPFQIFHPPACPRLCLFALFMFCMTLLVWLIPDSSLQLHLRSQYFGSTTIFTYQSNANSSNRSQSIKFCTSPSDAQTKIGLKPCICERFFHFLLILIHKNLSCGKQCINIFFFFFELTTLMLIIY